MLSELIAQPCDLLKARAWFKMRGGVNWVVTIGFFIPVYFVLMLIFGTIIAFAASTAAALALFFFVLDKRAVKILCDKCQKPIMTNTPWVCGFCKAANNNVDDFPFIHRCQHCSAEPKAYKCHHCGELIFLTDDQLKANHAFCLGTEVQLVPPPPAPDEAAHQKREVETLQHQVIVARLTAELNKVKNQAELSKKKSPEQKIEESLTEHLASNMAGFRAARNVKMALAEELKDDPDLLEKANASVDEWLDGH
jgi:hypothetical protein